MGKDKRGKITTVDGNKKVTYGIEKDHSLVHNFQKVCHEVEVVAEFLDQLGHFRRLDLDDEGVGQLDVLGGDDQVVGLRDEHLDLVQAVAEIVLPRVQRRLFDYLVDVLWIRLYFCKFLQTLIYTCYD